MHSRPILIAAIIVASITTCVAQPRASLTDSLINHSLSLVDLPGFEWQGTPDPLRPRIGIYLSPVPADTIKVMTGKTYPAGGFRVWHVMPHLPADEAGMLIGDIILTMNGKPIGDSLYYGEEYVGVMVRDMNPGDTARFVIVRNRTIRDLPVPVWPAKRTPMSFTIPDRLGPVRQNTWLQQMFAKNNLNEWTMTIRKQLCIITDQDFCTVPFTKRPNPWRLNAVTYLQHYPTRVGAYSRMIVQNLWDALSKPGSGLSQLVLAASEQLDIPARKTTSPIPYPVKRRDDLSLFLAAVQSRIDDAYRPIRSDLQPTVRELLKHLSMGENREDAIDTISDPVRKRELRLKTEQEMATVFGKADQVDFTMLADAAHVLVLFADTSALRDFVKPIVASAKESMRVPGVEGSVLASWDTPSGKCIIGGTGPNRYTGNFCCIIDIGGNDIYELSPVPVGKLRLVADMNGDDVYRNTDSTISYGQGAGVGCVDVLVDVSGNDTYFATQYSQGAGLLGIGLLADYAGNDSYNGGSCVQGAGFLGIGLLYDASGSDNYNGDIYAQGFGYTKGFGALLDRSGNDAYRAGWKQVDALGRIAHRSYIAMSQGFGFGMRPWTTGVGADGGMGVLSDLDGDDVYNSDFFSQGGSYWYGYGILYDENGSDRYSAGLYSQGNGIHLGFGTLLDNSGDDTYDGYAGLSQGAAHDWSAGCLEDWQGNDTYRAAGSSQGSALNVSFAWLLDSHGDDAYYVRLSDTTLAQGGGNFNKIRKMGSMGMLIDLGKGDDQYVEQRVTSGAVIVKGNKGIVFDDGVPGK